jgi:site-specific recombinase XerD
MASLRRHRWSNVSAPSFLTSWNYAVELKLLATNPLTTVKWKVPQTLKTIDRRVVVNPQQAAKLLDAVRAQKPSGAQVVTFFAAMYYSGLRPGEAVNLLTWVGRHATNPAGTSALGKSLYLSGSPRAGLKWA